jgi:hypothetical protein
MALIVAQQKIPFMTQPKTIRITATTSRPAVKPSPEKVTESMIA